MATRRLRVSQLHLIFIVNNMRHIRCRFINLSFFSMSFLVVVIIPSIVSLFSVLFNLVIHFTLSEMAKCIPSVTVQLE